MVTTTGRPSCGLELRPDEVHLWRISLEQNAGRIAELYDLLDQDERGRVEHFRFQQDRDHFIVAHGALRLLLGGYLDLSPARVRFTYGRHGKPALADRTGLHFSLSHSYHAALLAVTHAESVGVDIEQVRRDFPCLEVAQRFFSPREQAALSALPSAIQPTAFFNCWTRKEAYIKARGEGLAIPLDQFDVSLAPGQAARLLHTRPDAGQAARWTLYAPKVEGGYIAAVAVEGRGWRIRSRSF